MDANRAAKVVIDRISRLEPEHVAKKIIGCIYFLGLSDEDLIRLALGPDGLLQSLVQRAKTARLLASGPVISPPISPRSLSDHSFQFQIPPPSPAPFSPMFGRMDPYWDPQSSVEHPSMHNATFNMNPYSDYMGSGDHPLETTKSVGPSYLNYCPDNLSIRGVRNSQNIMDYPVKACHYFNRGFCKHGSNCRYFHGELLPESYTHPVSPNPYEVAGEDQVFRSGSLEKLELEIMELLKSRRGNPVSIASLPMMYYEKYGKVLQAEGYLTESQRHGKAGYSLTKLLARLKNSIGLIDRPHGQHALVLAEDASKYMDIRAERNDPGPIVSGSRQIYLTFPAESTFTEEDVSNYFSTYGPVQDVRIPGHQPKRMFGFVTFASAGTVKLIFSKRNPHYVCGARVLVKPYREKSKLVERKYLENIDHPTHHRPRPIEIDSELQASWDSSRLFQRQLMEERRHALELEVMQFSQLQLAGKPVAGQPCLGISMDELRAPEDQLKFPSAEHFNYLLDIMNNGSTSDENSMHPVNNCGDQESSQGLNLPDSPFASVVASSISAVI